MVGISKRLAVALCAALSCGGAWAAPSEYEVKAAFIHNIAKFVEWPAASPVSGSARLCVAGKDPFGGALDALQGKRIGELSWEIVRVDVGASLKKCRVLFIATSERSRFGQVLEGVANSPVLTVGDTEGYAEQGVMVNLYQEGSNVRFEINLEAVRRAGLRVSSRLLSLARVVHESEEEK
ncbi:MAG: YfiR family protein [Gallionella sp.]|jgi:hypothetical protein|nr:YfiR family protein [Gallionella sp.]MCK9353016.1 YfiR family protein [Gallionella sp.]